MGIFARSDGVSRLKKGGDSNYLSHEPSFDIIVIFVIFRRFVSF